MNTPWGKSDSRLAIQRGFSWVGTPSHGGFALTQRFAFANLSKAALRYAEVYSGNCFFEEDVDYAIVAWELGKFSDPAVMFWSPIPYGSGFERIALLKVLSFYRADYLQAIGVEPLAEEFRIFNLRKQEDAMRAAKDSNLVVAARGDWADDVPQGWVGVTTADGKEHLVLTAEYDNRSELNLLSNYPSAKPLAA